MSIQFGRLSGAIGVPIHKHIDDSSGGNFLNPGAIEFSQGEGLLGQLYLSALNSAVTTNQNDFNPGGAGSFIPSRLTLSGNGTFNVTGIDSTYQLYDGALLCVVKIGTGVTTFTNEDALSVATNRFHFGGPNLQLSQYNYAVFVYQQPTVFNRWVLVATTGALIGTWTPVLQYQTAGTSTWANTTQLGFYTMEGNRILYEYFIQTVPTNGTATGNLQLAGFPFASVNTPNEFGGGQCSFQGYTKAGYTAISDRVGSAASTIHTFTAMGSGVAIATLAVGDIPTGGTVIVRGAGHYAFA